MLLIIIDWLIDWLIDFSGFLVCFFPTRFSWVFLFFKPISSMTIGLVTFEEKEMFTPLPGVESGSVAAYSYPTRDEEFPRVSTAALNYQLRIGRLVQTGSAQQTVNLSMFLDDFGLTRDVFAIYTSHGAGITLAHTLSCTSHDIHQIMEDYR